MRLPDEGEPRSLHSIAIEIRMARIPLSLIDLKSGELLASVVLLTKGCSRI